MKRIPMRNGDEYDMLTGWARFICPSTKRRQHAKVKRRFRRRERRVGKLETWGYGETGSHGRFKSCCSKKACRFDPDYPYKRLTNQ